MGDRVSLTVQPLAKYGEGLDDVIFTAASADNHTLANDGETIIVVMNLNAATRTVTANGVACPRTGGDAKSATITVPAGNLTAQIGILGPFDQAAFNQASGVVNIDCSATADLSLAAVKITKTPGA
jgi:hypothetical protein